MQQFLTIGFYAALAAVAVVLVIGVANLARRDDKQVSRSNKLMRLRVIFQAIAIAFLVLIGIVAGAIKFGG
ncbi:MAG: twin transmembrane helix small protein [Hyphomonas sp.]